MQVTIISDKDSESNKRKTKLRMSLNCVMLSNSTGKRDKNNNNFVRKKGVLVMALTVNPEQYAEVDFMLHSPIYRQTIELIESWPLPLQNSRAFNFRLKPGQSFHHIEFNSMLTLIGQWFASEQIYSAHLKIKFPDDDSDHAIDIRVIDTHFRRMKFYSENGAYLPETLRYYQDAHKSQVLDLYLHNSGRFWIELHPDG